MPTQNAFLRIKVVDEKGATRKPGADDHVQVNGADIPYQPAQEFLHPLTSGDLAL
ncbi:hypothetical protein [Archangium lipolyticum]|uniref:hypothetical protein n=1 Tax=Archangium lipolyticum TaxID=2970465 RepID=UPI00214A45FC|nr:hypothetical protein [Archangium lipolyticum]